LLRLRFVSISPACWWMWHWACCPASRAPCELLPYRTHCTQAFRANSLVAFQPGYWVLHSNILQRGAISHLGAYRSPCSLARR